MANLVHTNSMRMYSWWWNSHLSPQNSKWLQDNLTDMDTKVKAVIKLIEEDADSFARKAEMYYKKRPELMKFVEEFYRAYRALAERYDHATGVIRHAHRAISEAFPNQAPLMSADDSPEDARTDLRALEMSNLIGDFTAESDCVTIRKSMELLECPFEPVDCVKRGHSFDEVKGKEQGMHSNDNNHIKDPKLSKSDQETEEILELKGALAKLEDEQEASLDRCQQSLDKLSGLLTEISKTEEDFRVLSDHANKAETEVLTLKDAVTKLEDEKESKFQEYQQYVDRISNLKIALSSAQVNAQRLNERSKTAEIEVQSLKCELGKLAIEKGDALNKCMQSVKTISNLKNKPLLSDADARRSEQRVEKAGSEVEILKQTISKLIDEKEDAVRQYQQCMETNSSLENKLRCAQEEGKHLNVEINNGVSKLKGVEEQRLLLERSNPSLRAEIDSLMLKMGTQTRGLTEKLGRLWACIQEERSRFTVAKVAFQILQQLHFQTEEELQEMASELQNRVQLLKVVEALNRSLQGDALKVKQENKRHDELNVSSASSIKDMQNVISSLMELKGKLPGEVIRLDKSDALQQEKYCLKEELKDLNKKHHSVLEHVHTAGLNPESLGSSDRELQDENSNLKDTFHKESSDKAALLEQLEILEQLIEKTSFLKTTMCNFNAELEAVRGMVEEFQETCQSLLKENSTLSDKKATLLTQLQEINKNLEKLSQNNTVLENSLSDAHHQLQALKAKSKASEDSFQLLVNEKAGLITKIDGLTAQLENALLKLEDLRKRHGEMEGRCITLEKESNLCKVEELQMSLDVEKQECASHVQMSEAHFSRLLEMNKELRSKLREGDCNKEALATRIEDLDRNRINLESTCQGLEREKLEIFEEKGSLMDSIEQLKEKNDVLEKENCLLCDKVLAQENLSLIFRSFADEKFMALRKLEDDQNELHDMNTAFMGKLCMTEGKLEESNIENLQLKDRLKKIEDELKFVVEEKGSLMDSILQLKEKNNDLEGENYVLCDKVLALENLSLIFRSFAKEQFMLLREFEDDRNKLHDMNSALVGKLNLAKGRLEESKIENLHLEERLRMMKDELKFVLTVKDQLSNEVENAKKRVHQMAQKLEEAEQKMSIIEKEKPELNESVEDLKIKYNEVKLAHDRQENQILKQSADNNLLSGDYDFLCEASQKVETELHELHDEHNKIKIQEDNLHVELKKKQNEINEMETRVASVFVQLQYSIFSQLLYEQRLLELHESCLCYKDRNECLKTQLAAHDSKILSLKDCILYLENSFDIHLQLQNPENDQSKGAQITNEQCEVNVNEDKEALMPSTIPDPCDLQARLQAVAKAAVERKELMVRENIDLHSKLDAVRELEFLRCKSEQYWRIRSPVSDIAMADRALLTNDTALDQISDSSSYCSRKTEPVDMGNQMIESWETGNSDGTVSKSKKKFSLLTPDFSDLCHPKLMKKPKGPFSSSELLTGDELSVDKLATSKRSGDSTQEGNKRKLLERLDSDLHKLTNLQSTVQDLKKKLEVTENSRQRRAAIQFEALKGQLEEADTAIMQLFDLNGRLKKSINDRSSYSMNSSFDLEAGGSRGRRKVSGQARKISDKIGRLQLEVQRLQAVMQKLDDENKGKKPERRRVLLKDYLYGERRNHHRGMSAPVFEHMQPSTVEGLRF